MAHTAGPFRASLVEELGLARHGLSLIEAEPRVFAPLPDGRGLSLWGDPSQTAGEPSPPSSAKDAARVAGVPREPRAPVRESSRAC